MQIFVIYLTAVSSVLGFIKLNPIYLRTKIIKRSISVTFCHPKKEIVSKYRKGLTDNFKHVFVYILFFTNIF